MMDEEWTFAEDSNPEEEPELTFADEDLSFKEVESELTFAAEPAVSAGTTLPASSNVRR